MIKTKKILITELFIISMLYTENGCVCLLISHLHNMIYRYEEAAPLAICNKLLHSLRLFTVNIFLVICLICTQC